MEVIEQLRLLLILIMFFMSYRYVSTTPALTFEAEPEEEEIEQ